MRLDDHGRVAESGRRIGRLCARGQCSNEVVAVDATTGAQRGMQLVADIGHERTQPGGDRGELLEQRRTIERGELDGSCGSWDSIPADWIEGAKFYPFVRYSKNAPDYIKPLPPFIGDLADDEQKKALAPILAVNDMYRPFIVAKEIPPERLTALRAAFWATMHDAAFLAESKKGGKGSSKKG